MPHAISYSWIIATFLYRCTYVQWQICISELGGHWFGQLLWFCSVSCHYIDQCSWILLQYIMTTLRSLISLTTQLFVKHLFRVYNKENTKAPHKCPCLRKIHLSLVIAGFPLLSTSNTQIVYMTWRHYAKWRIHVYMGQWTGLSLAHVTIWILLCAKSLPWPMQFHLFGNDMIVTDICQYIMCPIEWALVALDTAVTL